MRLSLSLPIGKRQKIPFLELMFLFQIAQLNHFTRNQRYYELVAILKPAASTHGQISKNNA